MARELRIALVRGLGFGIVLELMLAAAIFFFPNFREHIPALKAMAPLPMLRNLVGELEQGGAMAYVVGQHYFKGCNTLGTAAAVLMACGAVAGEAQRGTLEIWLSRPVSRVRILTERYLCGAIGLSLPVFLSSATVPWLLVEAGVDDRLSQGFLFLSSVHQTAFLLALYSLSFLLSTLGSNPTGIAFAMLFALTFEFALYLVEKLTHWSIFRLTDFDDFTRIYMRGELDPWICAPLALFSAVCVVASCLAFRRRVP